MKSSLTHAEYLRQEPLDEDIKEKDGGKFIPILPLEKSLDFFAWSTKNFIWQIYKDGYANLCVGASVELVIPWEDDTGAIVQRSFIGACNFTFKSIEPIQDWLATAKSMCIKNAAASAGKKFGRGLNEDTIPSRATLEKPKVKSKPDSKIMKQFMAAVEANDEATITMLSNIYDIKTEPDA